MAVSDFIKSTQDQEEVEKKPARKKRKLKNQVAEIEVLEVDLDHDSLLKEARILCHDAAMWVQVKDLDPINLKTWIQDAQFAQQQALYDNMYGFVHKMLALVLDTVTKGGGHVAREIENDITLRRAIGEEAQKFAGMLTNRYQLIALTCLDTYNGKRQQRLALPPTEEENEQINEEQV